MARVCRVDAGDGREWKNKEEPMHFSAWLYMEAESKGTEGKILSSLICSAGWVMMPLLRQGFLGILGAFISVHNAPTLISSSAVQHSYYGQSISWANQKPCINSLRKINILTDHKKNRNTRWRQKIKLQVLSPQIQRQIVGTSLVVQGLRIHLSGHRFNGWPRNSNTTYLGAIKSMCHN